jgi:DNA primase
MTVVDDIKQRVDIVDLISQYVTLKRAGRTYTALCPFHTERTPSFHVDPARQSWHCFGACGTGGDIFSFLMKKDDCDFREALRLLADRAGVALESHRDPQEDARRARLFDINEAAAAYFHSMLQSADGGAVGTRGDVARAYLDERRVAPKAIEIFQLGYAPNSWDALTSFLGTRGFTPQEVVAAGLAVEGERGAYDRFRHRLMFPIRDDRGRVCGFGGRLLPGDALGAGDGPPSEARLRQPKYVNTSQSMIFDKGAILYGLDLAKDAIHGAGQAVIVEGYMDAIAAHEHGFANVVASMGTALTERQVAALKRHASTLVLALDADNAGGEATIRSAYEIVQNNRRMRPVPNSRGVVRQVESLDIDLRVLSMPQGRDPDEVIRGDPALWPELIAEAKPVLDHLFDIAGTRHDLTDPRGRSAAVNDLTPFIVMTADRVVQAHYLQRLARLAQVDEATLRLAMRTPAPSRQQREALEAAAATPARSVRDRKEEFCLALLFKYPELRAEGEALEPHLFSHSENRALFEAWIGWAGDGESLERSLTPDVRPHYERIISLDLPAYDDDDLVKALRSTVWGIEQQRLRLAKRASASMLADMSAKDSADIAERARTAWAAGGSEVAYTAEDEADPATAFVDDMEAGLKVHQRILDQHNAARPPRRGGE